MQGKKFRLGDLLGEGASWRVPVDEKVMKVEILRELSARPPILLVRTARKVIRVMVQRREDQETYAVELNGRSLDVKLEDEALVRDTGGTKAIEGPVLVSSPMAGKIAEVKTFEGATVEEGQALLVLEAMKMESEIAAPKKGVVKEVYVQQGASAKAGDRLVLIE